MKLIQVVENINFILYQNYNIGIIRLQLTNQNTFLK